MSELEKAVEQLKAEGYTSEQIRKALDTMKKDTLKNGKIITDLDKELDDYKE